MTVSTGFGGKNFQLDTEAIIKKITEDVLKPEQMTRLQQLDLQSRGPSAFIERKVIRMLKPSDEQEDKIDDLLEQFEADVQKWMDKLEGQPTKENLKDLGEMYEKATASCFEVLSKHQQRVWKTRTGSPFPAHDLLPSAFNATTSTHFNFAVPGMPAAPLPPKGR